MRRYDREETVKRIQKMAEYQRQKVLEKIEDENEKAKNVRLQKEALLETRKKLRKEVDAQKQNVLLEFEKMKKKGRINVPIIYIYIYIYRNLC